MDKIDQSGFYNQQSEFLSASQAAQFLNVKPATLYAYVSRGLIQPVPSGQGRKQLYPRADLQRLKARHDARSGHGPVAASALRWGEPVLSSAITSINPQGPAYRGHNAILLARQNTCFDHVAELLWEGQLKPPPQASFTRASQWHISPSRLAALLPPNPHPFSVLALAVPALAARDPSRHVAVHPSSHSNLDGTLSAERTRARRLLRTMAALLALHRNPKCCEAALHASSTAHCVLLALGANPSRRNQQLINQALVVSADHELNPSTFAVRIAASTGADLYACVCAGLATLSGPQHGGTTDRVEALLAEAACPDRASAVVYERMQRGEPIVGFGHPLYPDGDPRARILLDTARSFKHRPAPLRTLLALVDVFRDAGLKPPALDVGLVAITTLLALPPTTAAALFAIGRVAGWIAHAFEQRESGFLLRPRARYVGPSSSGQEAS